MIPKKMNILERLHTCHLGQEKCKRRASSTVVWPSINKNIEKMVSQCSDCLNQRVEVPTQAWSKVGSNLFQLDNKEYAIIANYHSNYPDVYQLRMC